MEVERPPDNPLFEEWKKFTESEVGFHLKIKNAIDWAIDGNFSTIASQDREARWHHTFVRTPELVVVCNILGPKLVQILTKLWKDDSRTAKVLLRAGINQLKTLAPGLYAEIRQMMRDQDGL